MSIVGEPWNNFGNIFGPPGALPVLNTVGQNANTGRVSTQMPIQPGTAFNPGWTNQAVPTGPDGKPLLTKWNSLGDERTGLLKAPYNTVSNLNTMGMDKYRAEALRDPGSMSRWGQMQVSQGMNQNALQNAGSTAQARNQLAMQGGLRSGARERIARAGAQNMMGQNQNTRMNVGMQDEQNRINQLQNLQGMELNQANYMTGIQNTNIGRALGEITQGRLNQANQWTEAMKGWAAQKTAEATPSGGGGKK